MPTDIGQLMTMNATAPTLAIPSHLAGDYVELFYLFSIIVVGTPLNIYVLKRLIVQLQQDRKDGCRNSFILFKLHLNVADFLILFVHAFGKACWLATYEWVWGAAACKLYQYLSAFSYYLSANIIMCIAVERMRTVVLHSMMPRSNSLRLTRAILLSAWVFAAVCSLPQLYVFDQYDIAPAYPGGWRQCTDIWMSLLIPAGSSLNGTANASGGGSGSWPVVYDLAHLMLVFWGPMAVVLVCYLLIAAKMLRLSMRSPASPARRRSNWRSVKLKWQASGETLMRWRARESQTRRGARGSRGAQRGSSERDTRLVVEPGPTDGERRPSVQLQLEVALVVGRAPQWRQQVRSRVFRTTLLVVLVHALLWLPYNAFALLRHFGIGTLYSQLEEHANVLKDLIVLNPLINPVLYEIVRA